MLGYTVEEHDGVHVVIGAIPLSEMSALIRIWERQLLDEGHKGATIVMDSWLGAHFGGPPAFGTLKACNALRRKLGIKPDAPTKDAASTAAPDV